MSHGATEPTGQGAGQGAGQGTGSSQVGSAGTGAPSPSAGTPPGTEGRTEPQGSAGTGQGETGQGVTEPGQTEGDTFPRSYVENLRRENQRYRERANTNDQAMSKLRDLAVRRATDGILADSEDLTFDPETMTDDSGFPDEEKIKEAAKDLVARKPHFGYRKPTGDIGQGNRKQSEEASLADILRSRA